ncbi:MAG: putative PEP-binding protein, partial [Acidimicrobiales bacterium]
PIIRLMVPFVSTLTELVLARELVESVLAELDRPLDVRIGAMVETPRAALRCAELAAASHFLSFGTNDLTQMTFGFSRDDVGPVLDRYRGQGLLPADPFETIDLDGVGELVATGVERARIVDPAIEISVCGEHGGDPASIAYFRSLGIDHVSCSPFRVPLARLAAARAVLGLAS